MSRYIILAIGFVLIAALAVSELRSQQPSKRPEWPQSSSPSSAEIATFQSQGDSATGKQTSPLLSRLLEANWDKAAAQAVLDLNQEWFAILQEEHPRAFEEQIYLISRLGVSPQLMPAIKIHPEIAGLLAMADDPQRFADSLGNDECFDTMAGLYAQHPERQDVIELSSALQNNRDLLCRLLDRGLIGAQAIFWFPREEQYRVGWEAYEHWMRRFLEQALYNSDEKLSEAVVILLEQGEFIRRQMIDDQAFRDRFAHELWPRFERAANKAGLPYEVYLSDPYLWKVAALPEGERLLEMWEWVINATDYSPGEILFGAPAGASYPNSLHGKLINAMLDEKLINTTPDQNEQNALRLTTLKDFGTDALFQKFLARGLPEHLEDAAFNQLKQSSNPAKWLEDKLKTDTAQISSELTGNADGTFNTTKKLFQGRDVSGGEMFWATLDVADAVWIAATLGSGAILTTGLKQVAKRGTKELLKEGGELLVKKGGNQLSESVIKRSMLSVAKDKLVKNLLMMGKKLGSVSAVGGKNAAKIAAQEGVALDIAPVLRVMFDRLPGGMRSMFLKKGAKLQARQFMRADRKMMTRLSCEAAEGIGQGSALLARFLDATFAVDILESAGAACDVHSYLKNPEKVAKLLPSIGKQPAQAAAKNQSAVWLAHSANLQ